MARGGRHGGNGDEPVLEKARTGIQGLDEVTFGGLPKGRPTLVCGGAGSGKTLLALEFLVRGATEFREPGVFIAFEETADDLAKNVSSLGWNLPALIAKKQLAVDHVHIDRAEIEETGEYDLEALFVRLGYALDQVHAKRVALDTLEALFGGLGDTMILRSELRRLFRWLKDRGVTAVITAERGDGTLTRHGLEEYVSDCVILLDHRITEQVSTRRLRVVKYRGSFHGTNEYPFLISEQGFEVLPITSLGLQHEASEERISTGVPGLDEMLGGGVYRGTSILLSGTAGSGKSSLAAHFAAASCKAGERVLYVASEESQGQILRNMRSIGLDLAPWVKQGQLTFHAVRPTAYGLELHLAMIQKLARDAEPALLVVDPVTSFAGSEGATNDVRLMLTRLVDFAKARGITLLFTSLTGGGEDLERTEVHISSIIDTWLLVRDIEQNGERNRGLYVLKSRGMAHSNQIREFRLTSRGIDLQRVYVGPGQVLTGSARVAQESQDRTAALNRKQERERLQFALERKRKALDAQKAALEAEYEADLHELEQRLAQEETAEQGWQESQAAQTTSRERNARTQEPRGGRRR